MSKWKILLPMFLMIARQFTEQLRSKDANTTGADDEAAEAIDFAIGRVESFMASKEAKK